MHDLNLDACRPVASDWLEMDQTIYYSPIIHSYQNGRKI